MKVLAAVDTFLPTSADLSSIFRGSKLCPNKWYKPFPNGWLIIVLAPLCGLVKSLFLTVQSRCENSGIFRTWNRGLKQSAIHQPPIVPVSTLAWNPGGPHVWPCITFEIPEKGGWWPNTMASQKAIRVSGKKLFWLGLVCTVLYPIYPNLRILCVLSATFLNMRSLSASIWDPDMLGCVSPQPSQKVLPYSA